MTGSFTIDIEDIANEIKEVARQSSSEEDPRQGVEFIIKTKIIEQLKQVEKVEIPYASWRPPKARYEVTLVSGARLDALYGHLIIEYEKPKSFGEPEESKTTSGFEKAIEQVKGYIRSRASLHSRIFTSPYRTLKLSKLSSMIGDRRIKDRSRESWLISSSWLIPTFHTYSLKFLGPL